MLIELLRDTNQSQYGTVFGKVYIDGTRACESSENLVPIPCGRYRVIINRCQAVNMELPKLLTVPGFDDVRICFDKAPDGVAGWIVVGTDRKNVDSHNNYLIGGQTAFNELFQDIHDVLNAGEQVWMTVG